MNRLLLFILSALTGIIVSALTGIIGVLLFIGLTLLTELLGGYGLFLILIGAGVATYTYLYLVDKYTDKKGKWS